MPNGNRFSVPELEEQITALQAEVARLRGARSPTSPSMYLCPRCGGLYQSIWGCGCPLFPGEKRQTKPSEPVAEITADAVSHIRVREIEGRMKFLRPGDKLYALGVEGKS